MLLLSIKIISDPNKIPGRNDNFFTYKILNPYMSFFLQNLNSIGFNYTMLIRTANHKKNRAAKPTRQPMFLGSTFIPAPS